MTSLQADRVEPARQNPGVPVNQGLRTRAEVSVFATPNGWFQIGWSHEFGPRAVKPLKFFSRDLVGYRTEAGSLLVSDAHCPHFGAHLGYGGTVVGECIQCPFHGWTWGPDGHNEAIPYSARRNRNKVLNHYAVREMQGLIYLWHHSEGKPPSWEPPALPELSDFDEFYDPYPVGCHVYADVRLFPQMVVENFVDLAHLKYVHEWDAVPEEEILEHDETSFRSVFKGQITTKKGRVVEVRNDSTAHGIGILANRLYGVRDTLSLMCNTPVDDEHTTVFTTVVVQRLPEDVLGEIPRVVDAIRTAQTHRSWEQDKPIWTNQMYNVTPPWPREEAGGFIKMREWTSKFYSGSSPFDND